MERTKRVEKKEPSAWSAFVLDDSQIDDRKPGGENGSLKCRLFRNRENLLSRILNSSGGKTEAAENVRQEVRALCANWLKMQNLCCLLGAGASKYVMGFVGNDMYRRAKRLLATKTSTTLIEALEKLSTEPDKMGYRFEEYLSQIVQFQKLLVPGEKPLDKAQIVLRTEKDLSIEPKKLKDLLLHLSRAIIVMFNKDLPESSLTVKEGGIDLVLPHEAFLAKLIARDPQQARTRIFTTNYDTLLEQAMDRLGIIYSDGFTGTVVRRFNPAIYDLDFYYPGEITEGRVRRYDKVVQLYKLHGSINWRSSKISAGDPFGIYFDSSSTVTEEIALKDPSKLDGVLPDGEAALAILPMITKYGESLTMPYAHLFRLMFAHLKEPQTVCFIIGYRGWDSHINRIVEDSLTNPTFNCVIVDPELSPWGERLLRSDYGGRVYAFEGEWGKFENFSLQVLPDIELLKTELMVAKTMRDLEKARQKEKQL